MIQSPGQDFCLSAGSSSSRQTFPPNLFQSGSRSNDLSTKAQTDMQLYLLIFYSSEVFFSMSALLLSHSASDLAAHTLQIKSLTLMCHCISILKLSDQERTEEQYRLAGGCSQLGPRVVLQGNKPTQASTLFICLCRNMYKI